MKYRVVVGLTVGWMWLSVAQGQLVEVPAETLKRLEALVQEQASAMAKMQARIEMLEQEVRPRSASETTESGELPRDRAIPANSAQDSDPQRFVLARRDHATLTLSGQVNPAVNVVDDGRETDVYIVDNDTANSRLSLLGTFAPEPGTGLAGVLEVALSPNNSYDVSQDNESSDDFIDVRKAEAWIQIDEFGRVSIGKGSAASDLTLEYDDSLVGFTTMYSGVADIVGGMKFTEGGRLTELTVGDAFSNLDSGRQNRVRYDTPSLPPGVQFSVSGASNDRFEAALTWGNPYESWDGVEIGGFRTLAAVSYQQLGPGEENHRVGGSIFAKHVDSEVSLSLAGAVSDHDGRRSDPYTLYTKLAWDGGQGPFGPFGLGVDVKYNKHLTRDDDEGVSVGFGAVQQVERFNGKFYGQLRVFDLERPGSELEEMWVGTVGTIVEF